MVVCQSLWDFVRGSGLVRLKVKTVRHLIAKAIRLVDVLHKYIGGSRRVSDGCSESAQSVMQCR